MSALKILESYFVWKLNVLTIAIDPDFLGYYRIELISMAQKKTVSSFYTVQSIKRYLYRDVSKCQTALSKQKYFLIRKDIYFCGNKGIRYDSDGK